MNPAFLEELIGKIKAWWTNAPMLQRAGIIGGGVVVFGAIVFSLSQVGGEREQWEAGFLYSDLDPTEASEIVQHLTDGNVPYRLGGGGSVIMVPRDRTAELRIELAGRGYPKNGRIGYEIFDEAELAMTEFLQKVNLRRALQGEIESTIMDIDGVRNARVHLVIPEPSLFTDDKKEVTASVALTLSGGAGLKPEKINAIAYLVSASVEGLSVDDVVILDNLGNLLSEEKDLLTKAANKQFRQQQQVEQALERKVQSLLDEVIGKRRSRVRISAVLDFSQRNTQRQQVNPGESQVVVSEETNEKDSAAEGKDEQAIRNYELNRTVENIIGSVGTIQQLSMALVIDKNKMVWDGEAEDYIKEVRSDEEIQDLAAQAQGAVGLSADRGDQFTMTAIAFDDTAERLARQEVAAEESREFWTSLTFNLLKVLGIIGALLALRFIIQAIGKGVGVEEDIDVLADISEDDDVGMDRVESPHEIITNRVQQMVRERPEDAGKLIRTMLIEGAGK